VNAAVVVKKIFLQRSVIYETVSFYNATVAVVVQN